MPNQPTSSLVMIVQKSQVMSTQPGRVDCIQGEGRIGRVMCVCVGGGCKLLSVVLELLDGWNSG